MVDLKKYAECKDINKLSTEDVIKLMMKPYLVSEIAEAFNITEDEFNEWKKAHGLSNILLESMIRDIETILNYLDMKNRFISNSIRNKVVDVLIDSFTINIPKKEFYKRKLQETDFSRDKVFCDIKNKDIDEDYRLKEMNDIISKIDKFVEKEINKEKDVYLNYNNKKLYKQMLQEKENGKVFTKDDLDYETLYELSIIENVSDGMIGSLYGLTKEQLRYHRRKLGISNIKNLKLTSIPESLMYFCEEEYGLGDLNNYNIDKLITDLKLGFSSETSVEDNITINVNGNDLKYHVSFSDEAYNVKTSVTKNKRRNNGSRHNQKEESETKRTHGKIGEKIALEAEKKRLTQIGLEHLASEVMLIAQVDEDITLDGLGYDLLSFNEQGQRICIEVKTSFSNKDRPFLISKKELELMQGIKEEHDCEECLIYYILVNGENVIIKSIRQIDFSNLKLIPVLYQVS